MTNMISQATAVRMLYMIWRVAYTLRQASVITAAITPRQYRNASERGRVYGELADTFHDATVYAFDIAGELAAVTGVASQPVLTLQYQNPDALYDTAAMAQFLATIKETLATPLAVLQEYVNTEPDYQNPTNVALSQAYLMLYSVSNHLEAMAARIRIV